MNVSLSLYLDNTEMQQNTYVVLKDHQRYLEIQKYTQKYSAENPQNREAAASCLNTIP